MIESRQARQIAYAACAVVFAHAAQAQIGPTPGITPYAPAPLSTPRNAAPPYAEPPMARGSAPAVAVAPAAPGAAPVGNSYDYVLGGGDKLRISVFGEDTLSGEFTVAGNGAISFPLIGDIKAEGVTVETLRNEIISALKAGYLKDPRVSAEVLTFRPYYIYGEVARPGGYPYIDRITVINAIATAGGFSYRANRKIVFIKRVKDTKEHRATLTDSLVLAPGDTVRVLERYF